MPVPARLALPAWNCAADDAERARTAIDAWASSDALAELVLAFGGAPAGLRGIPLLTWLDDFSATCWDFRGGAERNFARRVVLSDEVEREVLASASVLGLAGPYPRLRNEYDTILMTGGMVRAGIVKPRFARELLESGVNARTIVFLGGFRPFAGDECELAPLLGIVGDDEFDAMVGGMEQAFGPLGEPAVTGTETGSGNDSWRVCSWNARGVTLRVIAAPSSEPVFRRANTADTYRFWAERVRQVAEKSVLVVTTPIYVPYQNAGAVELLGLDQGMVVETVGTSDTANDLAEYSQCFLAQNYLQELRAAIGAMRSLRMRLTTVLDEQGDEHGHK
jgi:hypothetical protein